MLSNRIVLAQLWLSLGHCVGCGAAEGLTIAVPAVGRGFVEEAEWFCSEESQDKASLSLPDGSSCPSLNIKPLKHSVSSDQLFPSPRASQSRRRLHLTLIQTQSFCVHAWICLSFAVLPKAAGVWKWLPWGSWGGLWWSCVPEVVCDGAVWLRWFVMELWGWGGHRELSPWGTHTSALLLGSKIPHHHPWLPAGTRSAWSVTVPESPWFGLEVTLEIIYVQTPAMGTSWMLRASSNYFMGLKNHINQVLIPSEWG